MGSSGVNLTIRLPPDEPITVKQALRLTPDDLIRVKQAVEVKISCFHCKILE